MRLALVAAGLQFAVFSPQSAVCSAQEWHDLTTYYLYNADFSKNINYKAEDSVDVRNKIETIAGWELDDASTTTNTTGATFEYGTKSMFYKIPIPSAGPNGETEGGCLTLCASMKHELTFYQKVKLPAGNYMMTVTTRNCNPDATRGSSCSGWWLSKENVTLAARDSFPVNEWMTDTIRFHLNDVTTGHIQVGFKSAGGTPAKSAMLVVDNVKLLRDTPYSDADDMVLTPVVVTDPRYARGATMAFGRIKSAESESINEKGFCWATHPNPTYEDQHTTKHLSNNGDIYWLDDLQPATLYYMRAYAKTTTGLIGYGESIKFYTIPKGQITFDFRNDGDAETQKRIRNATETAINWWNALTEMKGFRPSVGFVDGVQTADCSYGGWIRVGPNQSYQRCGTIMHEMLHGCGVIPWADTEWSRHNLRESQTGDGYGTGHWLGDRVSAVLDFWDNTNGSRLNGDYQHMWPYGINGAHEDNGSDVLYIGCSLVCQALGEDGLQHTSSLFAEPYYALDQEDNIKYYLTSESEQRGRYTAYLMPKANGSLQWKEMSATEAAGNDSTAWFFTFTPENQYYQLRNAATGEYLSYASAFKMTANFTTTNNSCNFHLMKGRVNVGSGEQAKRGYWIIHPTSNWSPSSLTASTNGNVNGTTFNIANSSKTQRWIILTVDELLQQGQPDAIKSITTADDEKAQPYSIYTLDGRRIHADKDMLKPGIYIIDGRKTIVK